MNERAVSRIVFRCRRLSDARASLRSELVATLPTQNSDEPEKMTVRAADGGMLCAQRAQAAVDLRARSLPLRYATVHCIR